MAERERGFPPAPEPLPVAVPDSHTHLDLTVGTRGGERGAAGASVDRVEDALALAASVNVDRIVQVGVDVASSGFSVEVAEKHPGVVASVALHPNEAPKLAQRGELDEALGVIERLAAHPRARAIGETGLDYFRTPECGRPAQHESFRAHIDIAKRCGTALVIHDRAAHSDVLRILDEAGAPETVVMHCFSGDRDFAAECGRRGYYLSFAGNVTFRSAESLREALAVTPSQRLLVETDAPFLTPVPFRGRPNASYLIPLTVRSVAQVKGLAEEECCRILSENTERVFGRW